MNRLFYTVFGGKTVQWSRIRCPLHRILFSHVASVQYERKIHLQGYHAGQRLHFVDFIFEVPKSCQTALQFLPNFQLPKQNRVDSEKTKW